MAASRRLSCSRHSRSPAASRARRADTNPSSSVPPPAAETSGNSAVAVKSQPRMAPADWLALRRRNAASMTSTPLDSRERMTARRSRSRSTAWRLMAASSLVRRRRLVMSLKECTRKPISSREGSCSRVPKSPLPTARVPAIRSFTGRVRRCADQTAPYTAASMVMSSTSVRVSMKLIFSGWRLADRSP